MCVCVYCTCAMCDVRVIQCGNIVYISFQFLYQSSNINKRLPLFWRAEWLAWNGNDCLGIGIHGKYIHAGRSRKIRMNSSDINEHLISPNVIYANEKQWSVWIGIWIAHTSAAAAAQNAEQRDEQRNKMNEDRDIYFVSHTQKPGRQVLSHFLRFGAF